MRTKLLEGGARFRSSRRPSRACRRGGRRRRTARSSRGPTAIAFLEPAGDPVAAAKALNGSPPRRRSSSIKRRHARARSRGRRPDSRPAAVEKLRAQVLGAILAPSPRSSALVTGRSRTWRPDRRADRAARRHRSERQTDLSLRQSRGAAGGARGGADEAGGGGRGRVTPERSCRRDAVSRGRPAEAKRNRMKLQVE